MTSRRVWATLPGFTATTPVDITVDGYAGKQVDYTVPDYATVIDPATGEEGADCANHQFGLWTERYGGLGPNFRAQVPGQQNRQWIIDVEGTRLVINEWSEPGTTPEQLRQDGRVPRLPADRLTSRRRTPLRPHIHGRFQPTHNRRG